MLKFLLLASLLTPPNLHCPQDFQQGGLYICEASSWSEVYHDGKKLPNHNGRVFIGFNRDSEPETKISLKDKGQIIYSKNFTVTQREYQIQRINNLDKKKVNPPKMDWDRIKKENGRIGYIRTNAMKECPEDINFIVPSDGTITGVYGSQRILNGEPKRPHYGIDYAAPQGTSIISPADGKVTLTADDMFYTGGTIGIDHGCGLVSIFSHLHSVDVQEGEQVKQGDVIGTIGSTGRSTGPHLDWRVNLGKTRLDPALVLKYFDKK